MAAIVHLDTHIAIWLHSKDMDRFSKKALAFIGENELVISPMVMLELQYLSEIDKLAFKPNEIFDHLQNEIGLSLDNQDFGQIISESMRFSWTRDPFDRIITASASLGHAPLITADKLIRKHYKHSVW
jgi:PIN domain nuclease of toxin-antitoxin system